jgi:hypothetical protein
MGIFLRHGDELLPMVEQPYEAETVLQELLASYPGLLSGDQDRDRRWLLVRRELGVAAAEGAADCWSLDYLFLDDEGVPTLVVVKRSADSRIRRAVVGQMLDYAPNAVAYLDVEKDSITFEARCDNEGREPAEVLTDVLGADEEIAEFCQRVKTNLAAGKLRLVFVADVIPAELQRIVEFLNEQMSSTEVLALEVKQYADERAQRQTLVSRVIGRTAAAQQRKSSAQPESEWTWTEYAGVFARPNSQRRGRWSRRLLRRLASAGSTGDRSSGRTGLRSSGQGATTRWSSCYAAPSPCCFRSGFPKRLRTWGSRTQTSA